MTPRTPTLPSPEPAIWCRLLACVHSDASGVYEFLLRLLFSCLPSGAKTGLLHGGQQVRATYKQLAVIGHTVGMTKEERVKRYDMAEVAPLSERHANYILKKLSREAA